MSFNEIESNFQNKYSRVQYQEGYKFITKY